MKHPEKLARISNKPDSEILQQSEVMLSSFIDDKSKFIQFFPGLDDPFAEKWAEANAQARALLPDYVSRGNILTHTTSLDSLLEQGRNLFQSLMLYAKLAFPGNALILNQLGHSEYESARKSQLKLPILLKVAYAKASEETTKAALMGQGMKAADIELLATLAEEISKENVNQENAKNLRTTDANTRIMAINAVYAKMSQVSECSKLVFQNDALRYSFYLLTDKAVVAGEDAPSPTENQ